MAFQIRAGRNLFFTKKNNPAKLTTNAMFSQKYGMRKILSKQIVIKKILQLAIIVKKLVLSLIILKISEICPHVTIRHELQIDNRNSDVSKRVFLNM